MSGYDIAVKISLIENVTRGLTAMSGAFGKVGKDAQKIQDEINKIGSHSDALKQKLGGLYSNHLSSTEAMSSADRKIMKDLQQRIYMTKHLENAEREAHQKRLQQIQAEQAQKHADINNRLMTGGLLVGAGAVGLYGIHKAVESASKYQKAVADFQTLNLSAHEVAEVQAKAAENSHKVLGSTLTENVKTVQDLHTAFGDLHHALEFSTDFTKFEMVMKQSLGEGKAGGQVMAAAKALEHRGDRVLQNTPEFQDELNRISKVSVATKGVVTAKDFLQASNTGKMAYTLLDKDYLYGKGAAMMTMNGGDKFGTMLMTTFSSLIGGHMTKGAKGELARLGLWDEEPDKLKSQYANMLIHDPSKFSAALAEKMDKTYGIGASDYMAKQALNAQLANGSISQEDYNKQAGLLHAEKATAEAKRAAEIFNRNTGMMLGEHILNEKKLDKDGKIFEHAQGYNEAYDTYSKTQEGASLAMHGEWENLKTVLGMQLLPIVTEITQGITSLVTSMREFAQAHPEITKFIMVFAGALAIITLVAGVTLLATAAFAALGAILGLVGAPILLVIGLFAALVAVGYMVYDAWQNADIKGFWQRIGQQIVAVWNSLKASASAIWNGIKSALVNAWNNLKSSAAAIWNSIKSSLVSVWNSIKAVAVSVWNGIKNTLVTVWNSIRSAAISVWNSIRSALINAWNAIRSAALAVWNAIKAVIITAWNAIKSVISGAMSSAQGIVNNGFSAMVSAISSWIGKAVAAVQGAMGAVGGAISGMLSRAQGAVSSGINTIAKGVGSQTHVSFKVDGRTMAQGVVHHMNASAYRGAGGRSFDGSRGRVMA